VRTLEQVAHAASWQVTDFGKGYVRVLSLLVSSNSFDYGPNSRYSVGKSPKQVDSTGTTYTFEH
jgi:hypothetical protein